MTIEDVFLKALTYYKLLYVPSAFSKGFGE